MCFRGTSRFRASRPVGGWPDADSWSEWNCGGLTEKHRRALRPCLYGADAQEIPAPRALLSPPPVPVAATPSEKAGLIIQFCPPIEHKIKIRPKILTRLVVGAKVFCLVSHICSPSGRGGERCHEAALRERRRPISLHMTRLYTYTCYS